MQLVLREPANNPSPDLPQLGERFLDVLGQRRQIEPEAVVDEHGEVAGGGFEALDVLDEEERFEQADR